MKTITIVSNGDDWEAFYVDDECEGQGHKVGDQLLHYLENNSPVEMLTIVSLSVPMPTDDEGYITVTHYPETLTELRTWVV